MRKTVFVICVLNLLFVIAVTLYSLSAFRLFGTYGSFSFIWTVVMASALVVLSYSSWKDEEAFAEIFDELERKIPAKDEMTRFSDKIMKTIMEGVDAAHYTEAKNLVDRYRKEGFIHPELVLDSKIEQKIATGKKMEQAIDEPYSEGGNET